MHNVLRGMPLQWNVEREGDEVHDKSLERLWVNQHVVTLETTDKTADSC